MSGFMEFAQILEDKIRKDLESPRPNESFAGLPRNHHHREIDTDPAHLAYLLSQLNTQKPGPQSQRSTYPKPVPRPRKVHFLTPLQLRAHRFFTDNGAALTRDFTAKELKHGFWTLAKKLHPDHSKGSGAPFIELKSAYRELQTLFKATRF